MIARGQMRNETANFVTDCPGGELVRDLAMSRHLCTPALARPAPALRHKKKVETHIGTRKEMQSVLAEEEANSRPSSKLAGWSLELSERRIRIPRMIEDNAHVCRARLNNNFDNIFNAYCNAALWHISAFRRAGLC